MIPESCMEQEQTFGPIRFLPGSNKGKYPCCHSLYIEGDKILIDPASSRERLVRLREEAGVESVWLSHWHEDHFLHLDLFDDLPLYISEADAPPLSDMELFLDAYGVVDQNERNAWIVYGKPREPMDFYTFAERALMKKHLDALVERSMVALLENKYYRI